MYVCAERRIFFFSLTQFELLVHVAWGFLKEKKKTQMYTLKSADESQ